MLDPPIKALAAFEILFGLIDNLFIYCHYSMGRDDSADGPVWAMFLMYNK